MKNIELQRKLQELDDNLEIFFPVLDGREDVSEVCRVESLCFGEIQVESGIERHIVLCGKI